MLICWHDHLISGDIHVDTHTGRGTKLHTHRTPQPRAHSAGRSGHKDLSCTSRRTSGPSLSPHPSQQHGCVQTSSSWCCSSPASISAPHPTLQRIFRFLQSCRVWGAMWVVRGSGVTETFCLAFGGGAGIPKKCSPRNCTMLLLNVGLVYHGKGVFIEAKST